MNVGRLVLDRGEEDEVEELHDRRGVRHLLDLGDVHRRVDVAVD